MPADHIELWASQCLTYCTTMGYDIAGVIHGDWPAALAMLTGGLATVVVVARRDHLPPDGGPRIEVAGEQPATPVHVADKARNVARLRRPRRL